MGKKSRRVRTKQDTQPGTMPEGVNKNDQYALHKQEFDKIIAKYKLDAPDKAEDIAELLTNQDSGVSAPAFAEKFGMQVEEAVVFLEWIKGMYQGCCVRYFSIDIFSLVFVALRYSMCSGNNIQGRSDRYSQESRAQQELTRAYSHVLYVETKTIAIA